MKNIVLFVVLVVMSINVAWAGSVTLEWDPNSETDLAGYYLYRAERIDDHTLVWEKIATVPKDITNYEDVIDDRNYAWQVTAFDKANNESFVSNMVERYDRTPPGIIKNLKKK